jgi:uncharacterized protein YbaR (Trm112 family)
VIFPPRSANINIPESWVDNKKAVLNNINQEFEMSVNKELLEILACPKCKNKVAINSDETGLVCDSCKLIYEIRDDIPIMLVEEAKPLA